MSSITQALQSGTVHPPAQFDLAEELARLETLQTLQAAILQHRRLLQQSMSSPAPRPNF